MKPVGEENSPLEKEREYEGNGQHGYEADESENDF